jgi:hypothetical protein
MIYPEETQAIGFFRGEKVFLRKDVHKLHTREKWLLESRQVIVRASTAIPSSDARNPRHLMPLCRISHRYAGGSGSCEANAENYRAENRDRIGSRSRLGKTRRRR